MRLTVEDTFKQYGDRIFSAAFSVCQNRADADDVVQDTLIRYYSSGKDFESEEHLKAWLLRAATPQALTAISPPRISTQGTDFKKRTAFAVPFLFGLCFLYALQLVGHILYSLVAVGQRAAVYH